MRIFALFLGRAVLQLEILALRHQLGAPHRSVKKPKLATTDRLLWARPSEVWGAEPSDVAHSGHSALNTPPCWLVTSSGNGILEPNRRLTDPRSESARISLIANRLRETFLQLELAPVGRCQLEPLRNLRSMRCRLHFLGSHGQL